MQHGKNCEYKALEKYVESSGYSTTQSGIVVSMERPYIACSPDALVENDILVEIKCPFRARRYKISPETVPYLHINERSGNIALTESHDYYYQVQGSMYATGTRLCHFVVYTFADYKLLVIPRNDAFISNMLVELDDFFLHYFKPALLEKFYYHNY
jgi:hypothetical protein